jgi:hypothetical protein
MLDGAVWLVWTRDERYGVQVLTSPARFIHLNEPVLAVQTEGSIVYLNENRKPGWSSNPVWAGANLEMARLSGQARSSTLNREQSTS